MRQSLPLRIVPALCVVACSVSGPRNRVSSGDSDPGDQQSATDSHPCSGHDCSENAVCVVSEGLPTCVCTDGAIDGPAGCVAVPDTWPTWVLHFADSHLGENYDVAPGNLEAVVTELLPVVNPHATIVGGDMVDVGGEPTLWEEYRNIIDGHVPAYPRYAEIPGNHDRKSDGTDNFLSHTISGAAGAGLHGDTEVPIGDGDRAISILRCNTVDSSVNVINLAGFVSQEQTDELLALAALERPVGPRIVAGHPPLAGLNGLALESDSRVRSVLQTFVADVYLSGHTHDFETAWLGNTLAVVCDSLGNPSLLNPDTSINIVAFDAQGPALVRAMVDASADSALPWPIVVVTHPANADLGGQGANPHVRPLLAPFALRTLVFSPTWPQAVQYRIDARPWTAMEPVDEILWQATVVEELAAGRHTVEVRVVEPDGSQTITMVAGSP